MTGFPELRKRAERARASGIPAAYRETARRALIAWIDAAATHGLDPREAMRRLRDGAAAIEAGRAALEGQMADPDGPMARADCRTGCAFCCILKGRGRRNHLRFGGNRAFCRFVTLGGPTGRTRLAP